MSGLHANTLFKIASDARERKNKEKSEKIFRCIMSRARDGHFDAVFRDLERCHIDELNSHGYIVAMDSMDNEHFYSRVSWYRSDK
jgi:hypothetical protein